jgi:hypothetical protein
MRIESAQNNVFVGYQAGDQVTDGNTNVIIGSLAGGAITVHDDNVIIGSFAASALTGNKNVVIGKSAYTTASSTGDNNIVIGFNAEPSTNTVDNEITIGDANVNSLRLPGIQAGASDGDVLTYSSSSGNITLQPSSGGGGGSGALTAYEKVFTGSDLVNAFNGNLTDKVTLVSVPANNIIVVEGITFTVLAASTGTTNYNANLSLYVKRDGQTSTSTGFNVTTISSSILNIGFDYFGIGTGGQDLSSFTRISPEWGGAGADLVLQPSASPVSITAGDRKVKISLIYRLVDVS